AVLADQAVVKDVENAEFSYPDNEVQEAEFTELKVNDDVFEKCKQNIISGDATLQDLCDNGYEFSKEQYAILEELENKRE
ncbi:recombinase, partial [Glaesserella parasuis]|nr:recombinase [Glaesserella parasuis]